MCNAQFNRTPSDFLFFPRYIRRDATDIIGLKQNPTNGHRFSPIFSFTPISLRSDSTAARDYCP